MYFCDPFRSFQCLDNFFWGLHSSTQSFTHFYQMRFHPPAPQRSFLNMEPFQTSWADISDFMDFHAISTFHLAFWSDTWYHQLCSFKGFFYRNVSWYFNSIWYSSLIWDDWNCSGLSIMGFEDRQVTMDNCFNCYVWLIKGRISNYSSLVKLSS